MREFSVLQPGISQGGSGMGNLGRIEKRSDLPADAVLKKMLKAAARLNQQGATLPRTNKLPMKALPAPKELLTALRKNKTALRHFETWPPGKRNEYTTWITGAKTSATRDRRIATAVKWIAENKPLHWRYQSAKK
jgi:uncharacterized protein YdeI (YjbR/CyaY-like superfamily)